ncbi:CGNR zinc finger domain-containing protein [Streptomyces sp. RFCAC02]|uniref:CGNR zinc finger domain-containing protein n=1 Tax=Streptomyces sp. RFCAC02 TaxID=2499143 RepID=UPI0010214074|nr:CGNR zinc finger domain-containing protein [Streptomyces sp. RFCAC02]
MQFNHYGGQSARLAAALVNAPWPLTPDQLEPILAEHEIIRRRLTTEQIAGLHAWSRRLARCFGDQDIDERCAAINGLLADASSSPRITTHDGQAPHLHYSAPGSDAAAHIRATTAAGLASVVCFAAPHRLGRCARCGRAYVDTSRNGRRSYCTVRCANNDAVARHRSARAAV